VNPPLAQLAAVCCPSATCSASVGPSTRLPPPCPSPLVQAPPDLDARETLSLGAGHTVLGAAASRNISAKSISIGKYKEVTA